MPQPFRQRMRRRFPEISRKSGVNGRYYVVNGRRYPSVTRVVNYFDPAIKERWEAKLRREGRDPEKVSLEAMSIGTQLHESIESYLNNSVCDKTPQVMAMFDGIKPLLDNIDQVSALEQYLYSDELKLAGTVDCIAEYAGVPSVIDFKSTSKLKDRHDPAMKNYLAQCAAYSTMWLERTGQDFQQSVILMVDRGGNAREYVSSRTRDQSHLLDRIHQHMKREDRVRGFGPKPDGKK